ncbi:MAG TPA: T9SS type A sorting domain-containing protein, partial [Saprospiraceae bacterium]|nr:T9SS type A sorting domain-containing protein [Saprospiraceae bacterium]
SAIFDTASISMVRNYPSVDLITLSGTEAVMEKYVLDTVYFTVSNFDNINVFQFDLWTPYNAVITEVGPYAGSFQGEPLDFEKTTLEEGKVIRTTWNFPENYSFSLEDGDTLCYVSAYIDQDYRSSAQVELEGLDFRDVQGRPLRSRRQGAALLSGIEPPNLRTITWGSGLHFVAQNDTFAFPVYFTSEYLNELSYFRFDHLYNNAAFRLIDIVPGDDLHDSESSNIIYPWEGENYPGLFSIEWDPQTLPDQIIPEGKSKIMPYQLVFVAEGRPGDRSTHIMRRYSAQTREGSPVNLDFDLSFWGFMEVADKADMVRVSLDSISGPVDTVVTVGMYFENLQEVETFSLNMEYDDSILEILDARIVSDTFGRAANVRLNSNEIDFRYDIRSVIFPSDTIEPVSLIAREKVLEMDFRIKQAGCSSIKRRIVGQNFFQAPDSLKTTNLSNHRPYQFDQGVVCGELGTASENAVAPELMLFPYPATDQVTLSYPDDLQVEKIYLRDLSGRIIQQWDGRQEQLDVGGLQGLYYLEIINSKEKTITEKLIIQSKQ